MASGVEHNATEYAARFEKLIRPGLAKFANDEARFADATISALAVGKYMRNAGAGAGRRSPSDAGPLRIVSGRLARGTAAKFGRGRSSSEGKTTVVVAGSKVVITKEVSVPYAAAHEFGFQGRVHVRAHTRMGHPVKAHERNANTPQRAFLNPALEQGAPTVRSHFERNVVRLIDRTL